MNRIKQVRQVAWHERDSCDVLIYDEEGSDLISRCLPRNLAVQILHVRKGLPLIKSFRFFLLLLSNISKYGITRESLITSMIQIWKPKIVITNIDNSPALAGLNAKFPKLQCISVQNGSRWDLSNPNVHPIRFGQYFTFGTVEKEILASSYCTAEQIHPIGSLRAGIFTEEHELVKVSTYDLCFISGYTPLKSSYVDAWDEAITNAYHQVEKMLFELVAFYALSNHLSLCIAMRYSKEDLEHVDEKRYFSFPNTASGTSFHFIPRSGYSSYEAATASRLCITSSSSLGYEVLGLGKKVLFAKDVRDLAQLVFQGSWNENYVTKYLPPLLRLHSLEPKEFSAKVKQILNMPDEKYAEYTKEARLKYMNLDLENLPQQIIQQEIANIINKLNY